MGSDTNRHPVSGPLLSNVRSCSMSPLTAACFQDCVFFS